MGNQHWNLKYDHFNSNQETLREALTTLGNGYFCTRGAAAESSADDFHYPGTYLAGGYNRLDTEVVGRVITNEDLVNVPNWLCLTFRINEGEWFHLKAVEILEYEQNLDLKNGVLYRKILFKDAHERKTRFEERRLVHMKHYHLALLEQTLTPENWSGRIEIRSGLDGTVINGGVARYRELNSKHLDPVKQGFIDDHHQFLKVETNQSKIQIAQAARTKIWHNGKSVSYTSRADEKPGQVAQYFTFEAEKKSTIKVEKLVAMYTSRDHAITEPLTDAIEAVSKASGFDKLLTDHINTWDSLWNQFDIEIELNEEQLDDHNYHPSLITRLHIFHLLQTVSLNSTDLDIGVPARGWHGEAYRGHIFWDEIFIFPTLNLRIPKITRSLIKYRHRRLDAARENAAEAGFKGAMFPWQSGSTGREESQKVHLNPKSGRWVPDNSSIQRHVNLAIAYNTWRYFQTTRDFDFLRSYGAELILEIARFFSSITTFNQERGKFDILGVMGPDEYHDGYPEREEPGIDNNAYTNVMVAWLMSRALEVLDLLPSDHYSEVCEELHLSKEEMDRWKEISENIFVPFHDQTIISQFEHYELLREFDWEGYRKLYGNIQRLDRILEAEGDSANRYQLSKQADVLMLFYLFSMEELSELFEQLDLKIDHEIVQENVEYYLQRTSHGSTLSRLVHSWVLSRMDRSSSWQLFIDALNSDIADVQGGTTPEGIHLGAMAGTIDIIQRCYTGIETRNNVLWFNPNLPEQVKSIHFHLHYRGHSIAVLLTQNNLRIQSKHSTARPIQIGFRGEQFSLEAGELKEFPLRDPSLVSQS